MLPVRTSCHDSRYRHPAPTFITVVICKLCSSLVLGSECLVKWGFLSACFLGVLGHLRSCLIPWGLPPLEGEVCTKHQSCLATLTTSRLCLNSIWQTAGGLQLRGAVRNAWATFACAFCSTFTKKIRLHFPAVWHPTTRQSTGKPKRVLQISVWIFCPNPVSSEGLPI